MEWADDKWEEFLASVEEALDDYKRRHKIKLAVRRPTVNVPVGEYL